MGGVWVAERDELVVRERVSPDERRGHGYGLLRAGLIRLVVHIGGACLVVRVVGRDQVLVLVHAVNERHDSGRWGRWLAGGRHLALDARGGGLAILDLPARERRGALSRRAQGHGCLRLVLAPDRGARVVQFLEPRVLLFSQENLLLVAHEGQAGTAATVEPVRDIATIDGVKGADRRLKAGEKATVDCGCVSARVLAGKAVGDTYRAGTWQTGHTLDCSSPGRGSAPRPSPRGPSAVGKMCKSRRRKASTWPQGKIC